MKFISIDYYTSGIQSQGSKKEICKYCIKQRKEAIQKKVEEIIFHYISQGYTIAVDDESLFIHDTLIRRRMWTTEGKRPMVAVQGHIRKHVYLVHLLSTVSNFSVSMMSSTNMHF